MTTFKELNLNNNLIAGLKKQNITEPTKVQSLTINKILDNKDLIVNAQTGSGKTLSYLLPMFEKIDSTKRETQVLILAPTHELVMQITEQAKLLSSNSKLEITAFSLIGEVNIQKQIKNIKARTVDNLKECTDCPIKYYCAGGCIGEAINENGTIYSIKSKNCEAIRYLAEELLLEKIPALHP